MNPMADLMHGRKGALWIAAARSDGDGCTLRPVHERTADGLLGLSTALDDALAGAAT